MEKNKVLGIVKEPGKEAVVKEIELNMQILWKIVNGRIEVVGFPGLENVDIVLNEVGKLTGEKPNIYLPEYDDVLVGTIIIVGYDEENDATVSLNEEQIKAVLDYMKANDSSKFPEKVKEYELYYL